ncbi:MAG: hypothetical protein F4X83_08475 [Chloroflexi bacterium]|nr:hypothetical protein [Chloroflexota bacterium]
MNSGANRKFDSEQLLEQYKLYVEMADRISQRRDQSNRLYASLLTALVALLLVFTRLDLSTEIGTVVLLVDGISGILLSTVWFVNLQSYSTLNKVKFTIINDLESRLPAQGYSTEEELLRQSNGWFGYRRLTAVEQLAPVVFSLPFCVLIAYSLCSLI